mmetsp:Transcript_112928/g.205217  ORF Transcript_112928/g.205217 Transcript_112928/m.205217 type:complete len:1209 (-) Transcript_112928:235-3861(-)
MLSLSAHAQGDDEPPEMQDVEVEPGRTTGSERQGGSESEKQAHVPRPILLYCTLVAKRPRSLMCAYTVIILVTVAATMKPKAINMDLDNYVTTDSDARLKLDAYSEVQSGPWNSWYANKEILANLGWNWNSSEEENVTQNAVTQIALTQNASLSFGFTYIPNEGDALRNDVLAEVRAFEKELRNLPTWKALENPEFCGMDICQTIIDYVWSSYDEDAGSRSYRFNGRERGLSTKELLIMLSAQNILDRFFQNDFAKSFEQLSRSTDFGRKPEALHSRFKLQAKSSSTVTKAHENEIYPFLQEAQGKFKTLRLVYHSFESLDVAVTFLNDISLCGISVGFFLFYIYVNTGSFGLPFYAFLVVIMSIPLGYVMLPSEELSVTSFFALFLMLGVGVDNVFIFVNYWEHHKNNPKKARGLALTLSHSLTATAATAFTTSLSFLANLGHPLKPLREFGFFVGMCVVNCFALVALFVPLFFSAQISNFLDRKKGFSAPSCGICERLRGLKERCPGRRLDEAGMLGVIRVLRMISWCPGTVFAAFILVLICFAIGTVLSINMDIQVPDNYPEFHMVLQSLRWNGQFQTGFTPFRDAQLSTCSPNATDSSCKLYWCEAPTTSVTAIASASTAVASPSTARCLVSPYPTGCNSADISTHLVAESKPSDATIDQLVSMWITALEDKTGLAPISLATASTFSSILSETGSRGVPIVLEDWAHGTLDPATLYDVANLSSERHEGIDPAWCKIRSVCFIDTAVCRLPRWTSLDEFQLSSLPSIPDDYLGDLPDSNVTFANLTDHYKSLGIYYYHPQGHVSGPVSVTAVWGAIPPDSFVLFGVTEEFFSFDPNFKATDPWAQRAMYGFCAKANRRFDLYQTHCWIAAFRDWLVQNNRRFPVALSLVQDVQEFDVQNPQIFAGSSRAIIKDDKMVGSSLRFESKVRTRKQDEVIDYMNEWDAFLESWKGDAPKSADNPFVCSSQLVRAISDLAIMSGTVTTILIVICVTFITIAICTRSFRLAVYVSLLIVTNTICLLFCMTALLKWSLGPFEILALIIFTGYAVTYNLHISHAYSHLHYTNAELLAVHAAIRGTDPQNSETPQLSPRAGSWSLTPRQHRVARAEMAVRDVGGAALNSAISTVGSGFPLFFCTLRVMPRMGNTLAIITVLSLFSALIFLPTILMLAGPLPGPCCSSTGLVGCNGDAFKASEAPAEKKGPVRNE